MWISPEFKVYLIREFQRLKEEEQKLIGWTAKRELSKVNYRIHTDAIKQNLIPAEVSEKQISFIYANEADVLNVALFGTTGFVTGTPSSSWVLGRRFSIPSLILPNST